MGRHSDEVETAVDFACIEALQNVVTHAGASRAKITLRDNGALTFEVDDDGVGLAPGTRGTGSGVVNMRDRLAEVGGTLTIESTPGHGTRVVGEVPHAHGAGAT